MRLYFDYNATAPGRPEVRAAVEPLLFGALEDGGFGNASSVHWAGRAARRALERARSRIAARFERKPSEVLFTSGGSEADNLAILGVALHPAAKQRQVVISAVEHPAVLEPARRLRARGVEVVEIPVSPEGLLDLGRLEAALERPTSLVSVMAVNNETGVVSPLQAVLERARARGAWVHTDAVQAVGRLPLPLEADLISFSGHKLGGLKGAGVLVVRERVPLEPLVLGGPQERGKRAGTESPAHAVATAVALELAEEERAQEVLRLGALRDHLERAVEAVPDCRVLGKAVARVTNTCTAVFGGVEGEALLQALDLAGVAASSGSACSSGSLEASHVLVAMGVSQELALSSVRFSLGHGSTLAQVERLEEILPGVVAAVRAARR